MITVFKNGNFKKVSSKSYFVAAKCSSGHTAFYTEVVLVRQNDNRNIVWKEVISGKRFTTNDTMFTIGKYQDTVGFVKAFASKEDFEKETEGKEWIYTSGLI